MNALLVDDDVQYCEFFLECLKGICCELEMEVVCESCQDVGWVLKNRTGYDIYFLDIEMEGINGIELAVEIRRRKASCEIFFVSFHEGYVFDTFSIGVGGFIRKQTLKPDLHKALQFIMRRELKERFTVQIQMTSGESLKVKPVELLYCKSEEHYVQFYWKDERREMHRVKLSAVEKVLKEYDFLRVHERYLVNRGYIQELRRNKLYMANGEEIPISRSLKKKIQMILFDLKEQ